MRVLAPSPLLELGGVPRKPCGGEALGVNEHGDVVGHLDYGFAGGTRAFIWSETEGIRLIEGGGVGVAYAINDLGQVVGSYVGGAFRWSAATGLEMIGPGGVNSVARGNNSVGSAVGSLVGGSACTYEAVLWSTGATASTLDLDGLLTSLPPGSVLCRQTPLAVNDSAQVVGTVTVDWPQDPNSTAAFLWRDGTAVFLGDPSAGSAANGINSAGTIVGTSGNRAVLWRPATHVIVDLTAALDETGEGWLLVEATAINHHGQIVGYGLHNGEMHAFLLTPAASVPRVTGVSPGTPPVSPNPQTLTLAGDDFQSGLSVDLGVPDGGQLTLSGAQIVSVTATSVALQITLPTGGPYTVRVRNPDGRVSAPFAFAASSGARVPTVAITPGAGEQVRTTFVLVANGFTPFGTVRRFVQSGDGARWRELAPAQAGPDGQSWSGYRPDCGHPPGMGRLLFVDEASQSAAPILAFTVTPAADCSQLQITSIEPTQTVRGSATTFTVQGAGLGNDLHADLITRHGTFRIPSVVHVDIGVILVTADISGGPSEDMQLRLTRQDGLSGSHTFRALAGGDAATFVTHIGLPPGAEVAAGAPFAASWRLRNAGTTTWNSTYRLVHAYGERMGAGTSLALVPAGTHVPPGHEVDVAIGLQALGTPGRHQGYWRLQAPDGKPFGPSLSSDVTVPEDDTERPAQLRRTQTVIVHGFQLSDSRPSWVLEMWLAIRAELTARGASH